jgi:hypothetical protein
MARLRVTALLLAILASLTTFTLVVPRARAFHPEPRVIVTVTHLKGGHDRDAVQRSARESWGGIVACYKRQGKRQRGTLELRLEISAAGKVIGARRLGSTLNGDVSACLTRLLRERPMPPGRSGSTATLEIELAPGDL